MEYQQSENGTILARLDAGEEIIQKLLTLCEQEQIHTAWFQGLGACDKATLASYDMKTHALQHKSYHCGMEIISMTGNITRNPDGTLNCHCHTSLSSLDDAGNVKLLAGHMTEAYVDFTCEVLILPIPLRINRVQDTKSNAKIWEFL